MKTFWGAVVAVVVTVLLTGCGEAAAAGPAGAHRAGVALERTWTPAPTAPEVVPVAPDVVGVTEPAPAAPVEVPAVAPKLRAVTPDAAPIAAPVAVPAPIAPGAAAPTPVPAPALDPFDAWMKNPTFTCEDGQAPGWINDQGVPTSCVAN